MSPMCTCVFFSPFIYVFLQGPYFCFVKQNKAVWKKWAQMRSVKPMLKVKPCLSVFRCKYFYDCKLNIVIVMLKALIIFNKQANKKSLEKQTWNINMETVLIYFNFECILLFLHEDILKCKINGCLTYFWRSLNGPSLLFCVYGFSFICDLCLSLLMVNHLLVLHLILYMTNLLYCI